jgi:fused signal recognition particle receptor
MAFKWFKKKTAPGSEPEGRSEDDHQTPEQRVAEQAGQEAPAPPDIEPTDDPTVDHLPPAAEPDLPPEIATDTPEQPPLSEMSDPPADTIADEPIKKKTGLFSRLKKGLSKTREILTTDIDELFGSKHRIDDDMLEELEELLITSDIGVQTAMDLMENITKRASKISNPEELKAALKAHVLALLEDLPSRPPREEIKPRVIMVVGVNGVGKTTTIGKLAAKATARGERVLIAAADTFRAAAIEQLAIWAERAGADLVKHKANADPAAVAFDAMEAAVARGIDTVFVDTAGRLHTKVNLMEELKKIRRTIAKNIPGAPHEILLVLDATTGQNALSQTKLFNEAMGITGLAMTKLDGTAKGGIVLSICHSMNIPLQFIGVGEGIDDLQDFDPEQFANALF